VYYPRLYEAFETPLYQELHAKFGKMDIFKRLFKTSKDASSDIGAWGSDHFWSFALKEEQLKKAEAKVEREYNQRRGEQTINEHNKHMELLRDAAAIVSRHNFHLPTDTKGSLSPKVRILHRLLRVHFERPTDSRCIIFVTRRSTARLLFEIFQVMGGPHLKAGLLTGLSARVGELSMSFRQQVLTLKQFRTGECNCLFATSVAEEGLDIPDCNLVVRFDLYRTMVEYIQSKGRARHSNSKFIDLMEKDNLLHKEAWLEARKKAEAMRKWCDDLPPDRVIGSGDESHPENELVCGLIYVNPKTGAKLTYPASLGVLAMFTSTLRYHDNTLPPRPHYVASVEAGQYVYEVILPETSPIRCIRGRPHRRKMVAKQSAAFEMIIALMKGNAVGKKWIDDNFMSTYRKQVHSWANAQVALHEKKGSKYPVRMKPSLWSQGRDTIPTELYLTIIDVSDGLDRPYQPLGLLTHTKLPDFPQFPIFLNSGRVTSVITKGIDERFKLTGDCIDRLTVMTHRFWKDANHKIFEVAPGKMSYWVVPVVPDNSRHSQSVCDYIDWTAVNTVYENEEFSWTQEMSNDELKGKFVVDRDAGGGRFFLVRVEPNFTPSSPVPDGVVKPWGPGSKKREDIIDYSNSLWRSAREHMRNKWRRDQPVFEAEMVVHHQNMLAEVLPTGKKEGEKITKAYLCPEPMRISAVHSLVQCSLK
jgi:endoribonuclease Dicer